MVSRNSVHCQGISCNMEQKNAIMTALQALGRSKVARPAITNKCQGESFISGERKFRASPLPMLAHSSFISAPLRLAPVTTRIFCGIHKEPAATLRCTLLDLFEVW